jgi:hypothetical protein
MNSLILKTLETISEDNGIKIIYACEAGSRMYGYNNEMSDYDVRFIFYYVDKKKYLRTKAPIDMIEVKNDIYDIVGWDLYKAIKHLKESNPSLVEFIHSNIIYIDDGIFKQNCLNILKMIHTNMSLMHHYYSIAFGNYSAHLHNKDQIVLKKYIYVIRPIAMLQYILLNLNEEIQFEVDIDIVFNKISHAMSEETFNEIQELIRHKKATGKEEEVEKKKHVDIWINEQFAQFNQLRGKEQYQFNVQSDISIYRKLDNETRKIKAICNKYGEINRKEYLDVIGSALQLLWLKQYPHKNFKDCPIKISMLLEEISIDSEIITEINYIVQGTTDNTIKTDLARQIVNIWLEPLENTAKLLNHTLHDYAIGNIDQLKSNHLPRDDLISFIVKDLYLPFEFMLTNSKERLPKNIFSENLSNISSDYVESCSQIIKENKIRHMNLSNKIIDYWLENLIKTNKEYIEQKQKSLLSIRDELTKKRYNDSLKDVSDEVFDNLIFTYISFN